MSFFEPIAVLARKLLGFNAPTSSALQPKPFNPDPDYSPTLDDVPRYPPFDHGLPFVSVDQLLVSQSSLVARIEEASLPHAMEAVRNLAAYVHLLPATSSDFFCGAGGLLRLCLETGFHSYIASRGNVFTARDPSEKRRELEGKWQLAAFFAGLCCELSRAIVTSVVTNDKGEQWLPFEPITVWLARTNSHRYFLRPPKTLIPIHEDTAHLSGVVVNAVIPPAAMQHITTEDRTILMAMLGTITRIYDGYNSGQFPKTVRHVRDGVIARDKLTNPLTFGKPLVGVHVEPYLVGAMRHLVKDGTWKINQKLARLHIAPDGAYVFWETGLKEILSVLKNEGAVGIPTDPRTLGELLMSSGVFSPNIDGGLWHYIRTPSSAAVHEVVRLASPSTVIEDHALATAAIYPSPIGIPPEEGRAARARQQGEPQPPASDSPSPPAPPAETVALARPQSPASATAEPPAAAAPVPDYARVLSFGVDPNRVPPAQPAALLPTSGSHSSKPGSGATKHAPRKPREHRPAQSSPKKPQPAPPDPAADSILALPDEVEHAPAALDPVMARLKDPSLAHDMRSLVEMHNAGGSPVFWTEDGLCVPKALLSQVFTTGGSMVIQRLLDSNSLYFPPGSNQRFRNVDRNGMPVFCMTLVPQAALDFGFSRPSLAPEANETPDDF